MMYAILFAAFLGVLPLIWWIRSQRKWKLLSKIPGSPPWSLLGNVKELSVFNSLTKTVHPLTMFLQSLDAQAKIYEKEKIFLIWLGVRPMVLVYGANTCEALFKSNSEIEKGKSYGLLKPWLGEGLLTSGGYKWKTHRKLLTPTFHFRILDDFLSVMNEQAVIMVKILLDASQENKDVDIHHYMTMFTFDVICETAMGISIGAQKDSNSPYIKALETFTEIAVKRLTNPFLLNDHTFSLTQDSKHCWKAVKIMKDFSASVVAERMSQKMSPQKADNQVERGQKRRLAFLDLVLEHSDSFDSNEIREQVDTFMFAGHDTTGSSLSWILYLIGIYEDVQTRLLEEIDYVFQGDKERAVTQDDFKELKYLDCVIKESLRLYSPVPFIGRRLVEDLNIDGYLVPKDTDVFVYMHQLHRDREVFPIPEKFEPHRFLPENSSGRSPFAYAPFSAGPRNCIGQKFAVMEEKVLLCQVLRNFKVSSLDQRDKLRLLIAPILKTDGPLRIRFESR